jgi:hypothetical protein
VAPRLDRERRGKRRAVSRMKDRSIHLALVDAGFEHLGKGLLRGGAVYEEVYKASWSTEEVEHFIYVSDHRGDLTDPKHEGQVFASFGIRNAAAEEFSCNAIHAYGGEVLKLFKCGEATSCAMRFGFERMDPVGWPIRSRGPPRDAIPEWFRVFITEHLAPTVGHVRTLPDLLGLLIADMSHFPWVSSNGAIRAAQIVALARQTGLGGDHVRAILEPRRQHIAQGGDKRSEVRANPTAYVDKLLDEWDRASK